MISELFWQCCIFLNDFGAALTVLYCSTWFRNCSDSVVFPTWFHTDRTFQKSCRKYYTVRTVQKSCRIYYTVRTVPKSCRKTCRKILHSSVIFFDMISELFRECGIVLHDFGTVLTVWYFSTWFRNCFDSVVFPTWFPNWITHCQHSSEIL
jgi:hypothetical protein